MVYGLELLALAGAVSHAAVAAAAAADAPKVVSMPFHKRMVPASQSLAKRAETVSAALNNNVSAALYSINITVGDPAQSVAVQLDTGSSDLWVMGQGACDTSQGPCNGGTYDPSSSKSVTILGKGDFEIHYVTPGSGVTGDYISENVAIGDTKISNLTMAVATKAVAVSTGIMGIGFDTDEAAAANNGTKPYPNIVDVMVNQSLINTKAYSLWLDDLGSQTGTILFGGYDTAKYEGDLVALNIQPDAESGIRNTMTVAWTSLAVTTSDGSSTLVTQDGFIAPAVLDSGTTYTALPNELFADMAEFFQATNDETYGWVVSCDLLQSQGTLDFGFGGPFISVPFSEFAIPAVDNSGQPLTFDDGSAACQLGMFPVSEGEQILFGDTFLRAAYVVYDLENFQISIAQTKFNTTDSNVVEIGKDSKGVASSSISGLSAAQTATIGLPAGIVGGTGSVTGSVVKATNTAHSLGVVTGQKTSLGGAAGATHTTSSSKAAAAHALGAPPFFLDSSLLIIGGATGAMMLLGATIVALL